MSAKRPATVGGNTPGKPEVKRVYTTGTSRKSLFQEEKTTSSNRQTWSEEESSALTQYICLFWEDAQTDKWPMKSDPKFWDACATAVNETCNSSRTGPACRTRVTKHLSKQFKSLSEAEEAFNIDYVLDSAQPDISGTHTCMFNSPPRSYISSCSPLSPIFSFSPQQHHSHTHSLENKNVGDTVKQFMSCFTRSMSTRLKTQLMQHLLHVFITGSDGPNFSQFVEKDFLTTCLSGMRTLHNQGKPNLIHLLSKCFESSNPRMPLDRMPFGMVDYNIRFFANQNTINVRMEEHYASWLETMFAQFGHKWLCLHRGPAWQYESLEKPSHNVVNQIDTVDDDIIQKALQQSSIDLDASYEFNLESDSLELVNSSICNLSISTNEIPSCSSLEDSYENQNTSDTSSTLESSDTSDREQHVSHLWNSMSKKDSCDVGMGLVSPEEMEKYHCICPNSSNSARQNPNLFNPLKSKINIASLSVRQIQKRVAGSTFSRTADIQMEAITKAKGGKPQGRWWIKADGCDVRKGLRESVRGTWAGDEDLGDGLLQQLFDRYKSRRGFIKGIGTSGRLTMVLQDVNKVLNELKNDVDFLTTGVKDANETYAKALKADKSAEQTMIELAWNAVGFEELVKNALGLQGDLHAFLVGDKNVNLLSIKSEFLKYLKGLFSKKRVAATHLLVFMIADELRNHKPYAIPVWFLPYKGLTDARLRELELKLEDTMRSAGMTVGFTTDGEFNSLRTRGNNRPVSVIELIKTAKSEARGMTVKSIAPFFKLDTTGNPLAQHAAIPVEEVLWLHTFMTEAREKQIPFIAALLMLRRKLFPFVHNPQPWIEGRPETAGEVLKSLMAIFLYRQSIESLKHHVTDPADFSKNLYQPEKDVNGERIHHREDHNHLLKRIVSRLRGGYIPGIDLRNLRDALHDPETGLTYEALTGKNKQSVPDCERLISPGVIAFLEQKGRVSDACIIKRLHNWHKAVDGRGLSEEERSLYCRNMKEWLLADWMPWFQYQPDFTTIDPNRKIKGICGMTQEIVIGLIANLEGRELRRMEYHERGLSHEHPRASGTDDVEGMIGLMHDMLGNIFDLKQFLDAQPKILNEFSKRIDPDLKFYYWTGAKERFTELDLPSFNEQSKKLGKDGKERLDTVNVSRRGDPGVFVANRACLPQKGQLTARAKFHRDPVALPPPPK